MTTDEPVAVWCDECEQYECAICHDFNGTEDEVNAHGPECPDR